jgi:hypothetical protein
MMTSHQIAISHSVPVEVLGLDWWSTVDGLEQHYRDAAAMGRLTDALIGPPETAVWQQEAGFSKW